jgi:hypothetical protein
MEELEGMSRSNLQSHEFCIAQFTEPFLDQREIACSQDFPFLRGHWNMTHPIEAHKREVLGVERRSQRSKLLRDYPLWTVEKHVVSKTEGMETQAMVRMVTAKLPTRH